MKLIFLTFFLLCSTGFVFSQEFYGGALAGFNGSQVEGDLASGYHKMGFIGGVWIQRDITPHFYWGMELKFNQKGSRIQPTTKNGNWKYVYRLNYIDLPVLVGYSYQSYLSFFGGFSFGYLFNKTGFNSEGPDPTVQYDRVSNWELGVFVGIKVNFERLVEKEWAKRFMLETRFQYSAISIDEDHDFFNDFTSIGQFNNVISSVLYYRIAWDKE
jgi:hypothetical protein